MQTEAAGSVGWSVLPALHLQHCKAADSVIFRASTSVCPRHIICCVTSASSYRFLEYHIVSDHIFLAATMLICLHTEIICIMSDILRAVRPLQPSSPRQNNPVLAMPMWREVLLVGLFVVALFLYLFTVADMYYTARYYHFPMVRDQRSDAVVRACYDSCILQDGGGDGTH